MEEVEETPGGKEGVWVFMVDPDQRLPLSSFFQPVLSGKKADRVKGFQGLPMSAYFLVRWGKMFQVLEAESLETPMMSPDGIKRAKG